MRQALLVAVLALAAIAHPARAQFCPGVPGWVYDDVLASDPFCGYITWMARNGVSHGCQIVDGSHRLYCPNQDVTRTQLAAFIRRSFEMPDSTSIDVGTITKSGASFLHNFGGASTFLGAHAGNFSMTGAWNTGVGYAALNHNTAGADNVALGTLALFSNTTGSYNTAIGEQALGQNVTGSSNVAAGFVALGELMSGNENIAIGSFALWGAAAASRNIAIGTAVLLSNPDTNDNTAVGHNALLNSKGAFNLAIGVNAGINLVNGSDNVYIANGGSDTESQTIRLGGAKQSRAFVAGVRGMTTGANDAVAVVVDSNGQLGTISSSRIAKDDIADMRDASAALMQLRPVTFHYKSDHDPAGPRLQYGLIAEEVADVYPGMVAIKQGKPETVMYQYLAPMLLNEFQKQQRTIEAQRAEIAELRASHAQAIAELRRAVEVLMARTGSDAQVAAR